MAVDMTPPPSAQWRGAIPRLQQSRVSPIRQPNFDGGPQEIPGGDPQAHMSAAEPSAAGAALLEHMNSVEEPFQIFRSLESKQIRNITCRQYDAGKPHKQCLLLF